jgi:hypothetical protein
VALSILRNGRAQNVQFHRDVCQPGEMRRNHLTKPKTEICLAERIHDTRESRSVERAAKSLLLGR